MKRVCALAAVVIAGILTGCSGSSPSNACKELSQSKAVALAVDQKRGMLARSGQAERDNFAADTAYVAKDATGYAAKVGFKGKDGRTLIALIDEDCSVGWTG